MNLVNQSEEVSVTLEPMLKRPTEGRTLGIVGDVYRFLATGDDTDGKYALFEAFVPPGGGPPPHIHRREMEAFFVLEGEITFTVNDERSVARPGTYVSIPIGTPHAFSNESGKPSKMLILIAPAGLERMFFEVGTDLGVGATKTAPPSEDEIHRLLAAAPQFGVEILPPPGK